MLCNKISPNKDYLISKILNLLQLLVHKDATSKDTPVIRSDNQLLEPSITDYIKWTLQTLIKDKSTLVTPDIQLQGTQVLTLIVSNL